MQIKASLTLTLATIFALAPTAYSQVFVDGLRCRQGGKDTGFSCAQSNTGDIACGNRAIVS